MVLLYNKIYCIEGNSDKCVYAFDLEKNLNNLIETQEISLPSNGRFSGRLSVGAASFGGRLLILGGYFANNDTDYVEMLMDMTQRMMMQLIKSTSLIHQHHGFKRMRLVLIWKE